MSIASTDRGLSVVVGVALLVVIVVLLTVVAATSLTSLSETTLESSTVHGTGSYDFDVAGDDHHLFVEPEAVSKRSTTFRLKINGEEVHQWDGTSKVEISCLYPGDQVTITTSKDATTQVVQEEELTEALGCTLGVLERFEYVVIHEDSGDKQVRVASEYDFDLAIDPDGPGPDSDTTASMPSDIGPIPFSNSWMFSKRLSGNWNGMNGPLWLFILTDNVHDPNYPTYDGSRNWTDPPAGTPGVGNYQQSGGTVSPDEDGGVGEPTNDIYILFKPGCDRSTLKIIGIAAGYDNSVLMDGTVIVQHVNNGHASSIVGTEFTAPGIPCPAD